MNKEKAQEFAIKWRDKGKERQDTALFWIELLTSVFEMPDVMSRVRFEQPVPNLKTTDFKDVVINNGNDIILVEHKGLGTDLSRAQKQSDGSMLTPYEQAERYDDNSPYGEKARWIIACNFSSFWIYDMTLNKKARVVPVARIALEDMPKRLKEMSFLVNSSAQKIEFQEELEVSKEAGDLVGQLYDELLKGYPDSANPSKETLRHLNMLCVQIVFCLYAEDAEIFSEEEPNMFRSYLEKYDVDDWHDAITRLFETLNTPYDKRSFALSKTLQKFPYTNGGLFAETPMLPVFSPAAKELIVEKMSKQFDWSRIIPTIFGAIFESTLNPETRRSGGMHYTSLENIHKVIDPLFLDDLRTELTQIKAMPNRTPGERLRRENALKTYQEKLSSLKFLDPAAGSGNFLTETYLCLRRLENEVISILSGGMPMIFDNPIRVSILQFYGIEINDFAVSVARTALWIAECQMYKETKNVVNFSADFLPLETFENIVEGNALRIEWNNVVDRRELSYIMGNPPFSGTKMMDAKAKADTKFVLGSWEKFGTLDYVSCWYKKAADYMSGTKIRASFVSTNSIVQGEQATNMWKPLFDQGLVIDYAYRSFEWESEAANQAHVWCVIIGFSMFDSKEMKILFQEIEHGQFDKKSVKHINQYLIEGENIFVVSSKLPINNMPQMYMGCDIRDGGFYVFSKKEMDDFVKSEPQSAKYFRPYYMGKDFISRNPRYVLWLKDADVSELAACPKVLDRIKKVKEFRASRDSSDSQRYAATPMLPARLRYYSYGIKGSYIAMPKVSSSSRKYIPMDYLSENDIAADKLFAVPGASLSDFAIITSSVHMAWVRTVAGRLGNGISYSNTFVYNTFPVPEIDDNQRKKLERTAQKILDIRKKYTASFDELYGENLELLYTDLFKAHEENDAAVMEAYGFKKDMTESEIVAELMKQYKKAVDSMN